MWVKRIALALQPKTFKGQGKICDKTAITQEIRNAWGQVHEKMYTSIMTKLDQYVSAEEFQMLKKQSAELRENKRY
jgi:hypothetical protein